MSNRYIRHYSLPEFDLQSQEKLSNARVLVVGCGGLGHPVLQYLCAAGVGTIGIADGDSIQLSNLQRQVLFDEASVGLKKSTAVISVLKKMNSEIHFVEHPFFISEKNAAEIITGYDMIADCSDNFETRYLLDDACHELQKPLFFAAIHRYEGQMSIFHGKNGIRYRDVFPEAPQPDSIPDCEIGGVLGSLAGVIGSIQATEIIKFITGIGACLDGKLFIFDVKTMRSDTITLQKRIQTVSSRKDVATKKMKEISAQELKTMIDSKEDFQLIDVREPFEFEESNMNGQLIPMNTIPDHIEEIDRSRKVVVHCKAGSRSANVIAYLEQKHGFTNLYNLRGGIMEWQRLQH